MAANLYARSIFGEDALANVSIEKPIHLGPEAPVTGHIRIRAKSQVMWLPFKALFLVVIFKKNVLSTLKKTCKFLDISDFLVLGKQENF